jgi:NADPH:quinone reductase-like Zn-dependent oxidoreductase
MELSGIVDAVGPRAGWKIGDAVMGITDPYTRRGGAQAALVVVPSASLAPLPQDASFEQAATLPMNGLTARRAFDLLGLAPGQTVAVTGAAGAVGGYAVQLAKVLELRVIADAAPGDVHLVRELGADEVVSRGPETVAAIRAIAPEGVDAVVDTARLGSFILPAVRDGGQLAAVRDPEGETERGIEVRRVVVTDYLTNSAALAALGQLASAGHLMLRVAKAFPPEQASDAHRLLAAGGVRGRIVLTF